MSLEKFISVNWYMKRKPYDVHTDYDIFYLEICRQLFIIIDELALKHADKVDLDEEDCRVLAYVIMAYFEDVVNGFGFWQSVIDLNRQHFKKRLPFFPAEVLEKEELLSDDIISADIHYLLYINYVALKNSEDEKEMIFFENTFLYNATDSIYNYLSYIEEVHTTAFYEQYLTPDNDFIDFKNKLSWFALEGYLTGIECTLRMEDYSMQLVEKKTDKEMFSAFMYAEADRLLFEVPLVITAYSPLDIFAGALRCNDERKEAIRSLKLRPHGILHIQNENTTHITFLHTATGEEFNVLKNSFTNPPDASKEEYWIGTVAKWNDDHYISGLCFPSPYKGAEIYNYNLQMQQVFQKHFPAYREEVIKTALNFRNEAVRYFGKELIEFSSGKELQKNLDSFNEWYFKTISDKSGLPDKSKPAKMQLPKEFIAANDVVLFIPPEDGFEFIQIHKNLLNVLQKEPGQTNRTELKIIAEALLDESISKDYWYYIRKHYQLPNLSLFLRCDVKDDEDFEAMLRIYKPHEFSPVKLPRFKTFTSEKISHAEAKKIFSVK